ncbi:unnamed protein product [Blumeria hordei]|uniref:Peptidase S59 domain-containing protein n=1 Tax=Blumeria hordei TaxID=2867405 RepID=A0A383UNF8_BLUHO|nr:unnamed protein product [Blumeria hordei]
MSGFGGFGGFGQNNNQTTSSAFSGFGTNTTQPTGFGTAPTSGFGTTNNTTGTGLFGSGTTSAFGAPGATSAFGNTTNAFGAAKPATFGTTPSTGGGLFGTGNTSTGGAFGTGGFGATGSSTAFGANNAGGSLFGDINKDNTAASSTPFGSTPSAATSAFGAPAQAAISQPTTGECQGTGSVPFQAFVEKEPNSSSNQQNSFQNITFQLPYQKFSPEELRLVDYNQGRRYGNGSNQAGAFGQTNFGGFGASNTGFGSANNTTGGTMFGTANTSSPFGTTQQTTGGFGNNSTTGTGSIFGAKPTTGGLFGTQQTTPQTSGLFGNTTPSAFGNTNTNPGAFGTASTNTGGSLFGQAAPAKPAFSFGSTQPTSAGTGFGGTTTTSGGFGSGGLFGNTNQQQQPTTSGFGAQQPNANNAFGAIAANTQASGTTSLFGNTQQKPAGGLFGTPAPATSTGGLFGNTTATSAFGNNMNNQASSSLFGNKPANSGNDNVFGAQNNQANTAGNAFSGFGNQNQQAPSLFGLGNNNNQQKPSLFGGNQQNSTNNLFGNAGIQQNNSLFGSTNNQQQTNSGFGGGNMFGNTIQNQQGPQALTASIGDNAAFGSQSLFADIASTQVNNPGPIATPLSSNRNSNGPKNAALPLYKLNSASTSRFSTPQRRGFGFSYSTYGSPASATSTSSTPGAFNTSNLLGAGSFSRTLSKSVSTSSLRRSFNTEDSILAPGAFSASSGAGNFGSTGSVKKLTISRNIRSDLFTPPISQKQQSNIPSGILKKRVSFDSSVGGGSGGIGASSPLKQVDTATLGQKELGYSRGRTTTNGNQSSVMVPAIDTEQLTTSSNQLAIVREEEAAEPGEFGVSESPDERKAGDYWMKPSKAEIESMNRVQRQKISGLTVGRHGIGSVKFNVPVDLTSINIDEIMDHIVKIEVRQVTVYPDNCQKPPVGRGLNVPSTITLENSWPRKKDKKTPLTDQSGVRLQKHIEKLKKVPDTEFVNYEKATGTWTFMVPHFTTYGCPDEDEDEINEEEAKLVKSFGPVAQGSTQNSSMSDHYDSSFVSSQMTQTDSEPEDTFQFKKSKIFLPGAFDDRVIYEDSHQNQLTVTEENSFSDDCSVNSSSDNSTKNSMELASVSNNCESDGNLPRETNSMLLEYGNLAELISSEGDDDDIRSVKDNQAAFETSVWDDSRHFGTPTGRFLPNDDWTSTLQKTISPRKQDRALLKSLVEVEDEESQFGAFKNSVSDRMILDGDGLVTSIDLMNSLFGQSRIYGKLSQAPAKRMGFEWPYEKRPKTSEHDTSNMDENERLFHYSLRPEWGPDGTLIYAAPIPGNSLKKSPLGDRESNALLCIQRRVIVSEHRDLHFARFTNEASAGLFQKYKDIASIDETNSIPVASLPNTFLFSNFSDNSSSRDQAMSHEKLVWELASILWDDFIVPDELQDIPQIKSLLRKEKLSVFWEKVVEDSSSKQIALARSYEEKAIFSLSGHKVDNACSNLIAAGDLRLSTLVALIGSKESIRRDIQEQLHAWKNSKILSEFTQPIRTIYEILAGNVCRCEGLKGPLEDRVDYFTISKRFGLDWRQAFGLRLWYGISFEEPIESAVESFDVDLKEKKETTWPFPWYIEHKVPALWQDPNANDRIDLLWGLLKLYSFENADMEDVLCPENSQLSPMNVRLSWQLSQAMICAGLLRFKSESNLKADQLTLSFASQLVSEGSWLDATFVLLHLTSPDLRSRSIQDHIGRNAGQIKNETCPNFIMLEKKYKIPTSWIWRAKALYLRSVENDPRGEVECLLKAGSFCEAHRTFYREVAPKALIELDYESLRVLLRGFLGMDSVIGEWYLGGQIYKDFLELVDSESMGHAADDLVIERLLSGLPSIMEESRHPSFMEKVAAQTMSSTVAKTVLHFAKQGATNYLPKIPKLPLTEDKYLEHTFELSSLLLHTIMAGA